MFLDMNFLGAMIWFFAFGYFSKMNNIECTAIQ